MKCIRLHTFTKVSLCFACGVLVFVYSNRKSDYHDITPLLTFVGKDHAKKEVVFHNMTTGILKRVEDVCKKVGNVSSRTYQITGIPSNNLSICIVPKAVCTMWVRLSKYMHGHNYNTGNPMTLSKRMVHLERLGLYKTFGNKPKDIKFIMNSLRTMTVRDPYTRLFSAYIDKLLLVDFWKTLGVKIIEMLRKRPSAKSLQCGHDVMFPEFIQYVITMGLQHKKLGQSSHWLPASYICDPCTFKPHIISKQETFFEDLTRTLKLVNLDYLLPNITSINPTEFEIKEEIEYNLWRYSAFNNCISKCELGDRIWTAFIYNGYVPPETKFPQESCNEVMTTVENYYELVDFVRKKHNFTNHMKKVNRKRFLSEAFRQISDNQIKQLKELYKLDFAFFGYEPNPNYLNWTID